ncbi:MAG: tetratricopeptide repeat protein, partial [Gammaproteobacteria bacterium]|nr:tetratricopeptide repeat protein [Gammaproteobacteria bacterium]
ILYNELGATYQNMKQPEQAVTVFSHALTLNPHPATLYYNRGDAYYCCRKYIEAVNDYTEAINRDPQNPIFYHHRGWILSCLERHLEAIKDFTTAITLDSQNAGYYTDRGNEYCTIERYSEAIKDFTEAIRLSPLTAKFYGNRASAYISLQEHNKAILDLTEASRLNPEESYIHCKTLIENLTQKINRNPCEARNYFLRGKIAYYGLSVNNQLSANESYCFWDYIAAQHWSTDTENFAHDPKFNLASFSPATQALLPLLAGVITHLKKSFRAGTFNVSMPPPANFPSCYLRAFDEMVVNLATFDF